MNTPESLAKAVHAYANALSKALGEDTAADVAMLHACANALTAAHARYEASEAMRDAYARALVAGHVDADLVAMLHTVTLERDALTGTVETLEERLAHATDPAPTSPVTCKVCQESFVSDDVCGNCA